MKKVLLTILLLGSSANCLAYGRFGYVPRFPIRRTQERTRSYTEDFRPLFLAAPIMVGARALHDCYERFRDDSFVRSSVEVGKDFVDRGIKQPYNRHDKLQFDDAAEIALNSVFAVILAPLVLGTGAVIKTGQGALSAVNAISQSPVQQVAVLAASAGLAGYCMYKLYEQRYAGQEE